MRAGSAGSTSTRRQRARPATTCVRFFPQLRGRRITHAWGGPIDVSPTHLPIFGSRGRVHHGFGFTGNGVGPSYLGGEILARLALDRRDDLTRLALVDPERKLMPPEPLRWAGGSVIRPRSSGRRAEDAGRAAGSRSRASSRAYRVDSVSVCRGDSRSSTVSSAMSPSTSSGATATARSASSA